LSAVALHHVIDGEGPTLLLGPSLGSTTEMWAPQVRALAEHFRVVRYDHRGHGASPVPDGPYELADLGSDVLELLDTLEVEQALVGGLSLGGMVAMWLGVNAPERVERLALCCTSAKLGPPSMWRERAAAVRAAGSTSAIAEAVVERWLTPGYAKEHPGLVADLRAMVAGVDPAGYVACCGAIERMDLVAGLERIAAPALVVAAREDPATPPEHAELIASRIAAARLEILEDAAHLANVQQSDTVTRLLLEHFTGVRQGSTEP
jgi:3-oxoadipate enol-lactonase